MEFKVSQSYKKKVLRKVLYSNILTYALTVIFLDVVLIISDKILEVMIITPILIVISIFRIISSYKKSKKELSSEYSILKEEFIISLRGENCFKTKIEKVIKIKKGKFAYHIESGMGNAAIPKGLENIEQFIKEFNKFLKFDFLS